MNWSWIGVRETQWDWTWTWACFLQIKFMQGFKSGNKRVSSVSKKFSSIIIYIYAKMFVLLLVFCLKKKRRKISSWCWTMISLDHIEPQQSWCIDVSVLDQIPDACCHLMMTVVSWWSGPNLDYYTLESRVEASFIISTPTLLTLFKVWMFLSWMPPVDVLPWCTNAIITTNKKFIFWCHHHY